MPEPTFAARGLTYRYPGAAEPVLRDVTVELEPGSFTVLAGLSGSGKSTLLRAACGLIPHFHGGDISGEVSVGGLDVRHNGPAEIASVCGTIFQDPESQVVMNGVRAEIALPLEHRGNGASAVALGVEEAALSLGVAHLLERRTDSLSGGELQRVALAAAIATRPSLLVLDEPTSQLDPVAGDELVWLLRRLNEEWGTAVLIAEHRLERCLPAADRVIALERGAVVHDGAPEEHLGWAVAKRPELATPLARLFDLSGRGRPFPVSVKEAKDGLRTSDFGLPEQPPAADRRPVALRLRGVWLEIPHGPAILRGLDLSLPKGQRVALMGRNGAGKSTLLRVAKGLVKPTRGKVKAADEVALLLQNPGDYLLHEHAREETTEAGLVRAGLEGRGEDNPKDLSGGERQRLALEVALGAEGEAGAVLLDEPTRGMDRAHKAKLAARLGALARGGAGVLVATHDAEWAATWADRVVLLGTGEVIADGSAREILTGGWHFTTDTARVTGAALTPEQGAELLAQRRAELVQ